MRKEWQTVSLGTIAEVITGTTPSTNIPEYYCGNYPFVSPADINGDFYLKSTSKTLSEAGISKAKPVPKDTILFTCTGIIGKICVAHTFLATNQQINAVIPDKEKVEFTFLYYALLSQVMQVRNLANTNVIPIVNKSTFEELPIDFPPLPEQQKIAAILRTWDEAIEKCNLYLSIMSRKRAHIIQKTLNAKNWPLATIADIADIIVSNVDKKSIEGEQSVRLCNYMDVFYNRYITNAITFMEATASDREIIKYMLRKGDAVFTKDSETPEDIAVCASIEENIEGLVCGYHLAIARPKSDIILGAYLAEAINSPYVHHQFVRCANGATRFGLTKGDIHDIEIPLPPLKEQEKIIAALSQYDYQKELIDQRVKHLQAQKRGLMQKLLTGQWRVKTSDERGGI